jgi:hypothetical protein
MAANNRLPTGGQLITLSGTDVSFVAARSRHGAPANLSAAIFGVLVLRASDRHLGAMPHGRYDGMFGDRRGPEYDLLKRASTA